MAYFEVRVFIIIQKIARKHSTIGSRSIYVLLLIYGASTATTTLPCITVVLSTPITSAETIAAGIASITVQQRLLLLTSYFPFFLIPLVIPVDMAYRILSLVRDAERASKVTKSQ